VEDASSTFRDLGDLPGDGVPMGPIVTSEDLLPFRERNALRDGREEAWMVRRAVHLHEESADPGGV